MFAIHTPTSVTLKDPDDDGPGTLINFRTNDADTARCVMEIVQPDGHTHRITFNTRGGIIDQQCLDPEKVDPDAPTPNASAHIVDGVDTRAFNPYTYQGPVTADTAYRDGGGVGNKAVNVTPEQAKENAENAKQHYAEAEERAEKMREELLNRKSETAEQRAEREKKEREDELKRVYDKAREDAAKLEAGEVAKARAYPDEGTQKSVEGKKMDGSPQTNPDGSPMAPAPSNPLPGSPPPHPLDQPDPGKVNTTSSMQPA